MYFDNLTIAGLIALVPYALLPLLFGRETVRVQRDRGGRGDSQPNRSIQLRPGLASRRPASSGAMRRGLTPRWRQTAPRNPRALLLIRMHSRSSAWGTD